MTYSPTVAIPSALIDLFFFKLFYFVKFGIEIIQLAFKPF